MGQLFSRAFKRITQGSQSRCPSNQSQQRIESQDLRDKPENRDQRGSSGPSEAIAVGQSIDSAEYAALETNNDHDNSQGEEENKENTIISSEENAASPAAAVAAAPLAASTTNGSSDKDTHDVEEAVIKIQALVRGHLARKALKDAHQQSVSPANALGQSQFDEDSLIRNPPIAIFSSAPPLNLPGDHKQLQQAIESSNNNQARTPLASIAEVSEIAGSRLDAGAAGESAASSNTSASGRKKLAALNTRKSVSPSTLEVGGGYDSAASRGSSPTPSHASIDLGDGRDAHTSFSASIEILDHNLRPTDRFAAVLHHREEPPKDVSPPQPRPPCSLPSLPTISTPDDENSGDQQLGAGGAGRGRGGADETEETRITMPAGTPDSLASVESEEAAAVRIQSAFRGYRTRKNSPYRTRSQNSSNANSPVVGGVPTPPRLEPAATNDSDKRVDINMAAPDQGQEQLTDGTEGQRTSRPRHRNDGDEGAAELVAIEEQVSVNQGDEEVTATATTDASTETVKQLTLPHPMKAVESTATEAAAAQQSQEESTASLSFGIGQSEANTLDTSDGPMGLSSALETGPQTYSSPDVGNRSAAGGDDAGIGCAATSPAGLAAPQQAQLSGSAGGGGTKESRASIDTDSSILGAALSLNEADISVAEQSNNVQPAAQRASVPTVQMLEQIDEDKSLGASVASEQLELEARKLVEELTGGSTDRGRHTDGDDDECALEEATIELEEALEEATEQEAGAEASLLLSSALGNEQLAQLELESDEIERRDPRGHIGSNLTDEVLGGSGGSSPGGSSSDEDDKGQQQQQQQQQRQHQQQHQQQAGKNKKKNRNKRKGKK